MGELIDLGSGLHGGFGLMSAVVSVLALGIYALVTGERENNNNDDDDSSPGGGLMQPVA